jgi:hypothetical protein
MKYVGAQVLVFTIFLSGCNLPAFAPKIITADGASYTACRGVIWISSSSGFFSNEQSFTISFEQVGGKSIWLYNVKALVLQDPPSHTIAPFPINLPDPKTTADMDGKPFTSGSIYTWPDGSKAKLQNGLWMPVKLHDACSPPSR